MSNSEIRTEEELRRQIHAYQELLESPGWALMQEFMKGQLEQNLQMLIKPSSDQMSVLQAEFAKGKIGMANEFIAHPVDQLEDAKAILKVMIENSEEEGEDGEPTPSSEETQPQETETVDG